MQFNPRTAGKNPGGCAADDLALAHEPREVIIGLQEGFAMPACKLGLDPVDNAGQQRSQNKGQRKLSRNRRLCLVSCAQPPYKQTHNCGQNVKNIKMYFAVLHDLAGIAQALYAFKKRVVDGAARRSGAGTLIPLVGEQTWSQLLAFS